jgi:hypothetical protein
VKELDNMASFCRAITNRSTLYEPGLLVAISQSRFSDIMTVGRILKRFISQNQTAFIARQYEAVEQLSRQAKHKQKTFFYPWVSSHRYPIGRRRRGLHRQQRSANYFNDCPSFSELLTFETDKQCYQSLLI